MYLLGRLLGALRREAVVHAEAGVQFLPVVLVEGLVRLVVLEVVRLCGQPQLQLERTPFQCFWSSTVHEPTAEVTFELLITESMPSFCQQKFRPFFRCMYRVVC